MSDHDAAQPSTSGPPRPDQGDEFNVRTVLINQDMPDAARVEQQAPGQAPGAVPGAAPGARAGLWRPVQPDLSAGPSPEEQTRAFPTGTAQMVVQSGVAPADPCIQANPYAQQGGLGQAGQSGQPGRPDLAAAGGFGGAQPGTVPANPYIQANPYAQQGGLGQAGRSVQSAWGGSTVVDGAAPASSSFAQSTPGIPSAPDTSSAPAAGAAPGLEASRGTPHWPGQQSQAQLADLQDQQSFAQQPAPHPHPFSGGCRKDEVGMFSVSPTAITRAEAEQATEAFVPAATQAVAQSASSSSSTFPSRSSAFQWGPASSSDAAAGQAPSSSDMVPPAASSPFERPVGGGVLAAVRSEEVETADFVGGWMLTMLLAGISLSGLVYILILVFGNGRPASKKNWARATLVQGVIASVLVLVFYAALSSAVLAVISSNAR